MNKIKLNNGQEIPQIGYGTWQIKPEDTKELILQAYKVGYRHFDTAQIYNNEYEIGQAIQELNRKELFITTKVWVPNYNSKIAFLTSIQQSLHRLQVKPVDLLLLHWPIKGKNVQAYQWLEEALEMGLTKSIGVSNFMINHLEEILKIAKYKPVMNQIEFHPLIQQADLIKFCQKHQIAITGYSNLKSYLNHQFSPQEKLVVDSIASAVNKTATEVILRYVYQANLVIIPKSSNPTRMKQNLDIVNFTLTSKQMNQIKMLDHDQYDKSAIIYEGGSWASEEMQKPDFLFDKHF